MYRRPKFLEVLHEIRQEMSREADYDVDLFAEMVREGNQPKLADRRTGGEHILQPLVFEVLSNPSNESPKTKK